MPRKEEYVRSEFVRRAQLRDAPKALAKEEYVRSMGQSVITKPAVMKDAQTMPSRVEYVGGMEQRRG